jgi:hypothetical protein
MTDKKKCPKAETEGGRFCPVCFPDVVQAKMEQLDRLGDCLQTLAQTQEQFEEKTLEVIPSCSLTTINDPIEACGGGDQFSVVFQGD